MAGNSVLEGGPEDGTEIDVAWPPAPKLFRRVGDQIIEYDLQDDPTEQGRLRWKAAAKRHKHIDPDPRGQVDDDAPKRRRGA